MELSEEEIEQQNLKTFASSFVERWGSYSSDSNCENLISLKILSTDAMKIEIDRLVSTGKCGAMDTVTGFYGVSTKALSSNIKNIDANSAVLRVMCQKKIEENDDVRVVYEEVEVEMVKEAGKWLVDGISS
ncbi:hypothetical protein ACFL23_04485 [Patescibacteria group bacterium]